MKTNLMGVRVVMVAMFSQTVLAGIPEGNFSGKGLWKDQDQRGEYEVKSQLTKTNLNSSYREKDGTLNEISLTLKDSGNGFFIVKGNGGLSGKGYCLEQAQVCHYEVSTKKVKVEETITMLDGKLYRFGSKLVGGRQIMWQEAQEAISE